MDLKFNPENIFFLQFSPLKEALIPWKKKNNYFNKMTLRKLGLVLTFSLNLETGLRVHKYRGRKTSREELALNAEFIL